MEFNSIGFVVLVTILFFIYWNIADRYRSMILIGFSILFYLSFDYRFLPVLIITVLLTYYLGIVLEDGKRKWLYRTGIVMVLIPLLFFKYFNFVSGSITSILNTVSLKLDPVFVKLAMPIGISFYTFSIISYLTDVYTGKRKAERSLCNTALLVAYFPKLVSGPIVRSEEFFEQLRMKKSFDYDRITYGLKRLAWGAFKKFAVADTLALGVNAVYGDLGNYSGMVLLIVSFMYTLQIYCDFSGYTDLVLGISGLFGIDLVDNFKSPYFSKSIKEFWGRWHISLSSWLKDYIYIPLGGSRCGRLRQARNLLVTFLVSGIWHGASWTFVVWGGLHGLAQISERWFGTKQGNKQETAAVTAGRIAVTFLIVNFLWIFFRAGSFEDVFYIFSHMFAGIGSPFAYVREFIGHLQITPGGILILFAEALGVMIYDYCSLTWDPLLEIKRLPAWLRWGIYAGMIVLILCLYPKESVGSFIYVQF